MPKTLLVVDDSANIREAARLALAGEEWRVEVAASADEAMEALRNQTPDAVLCDVALGEEDGYDLVRRIRRSGDTGSLPVILMGAKVSPTASTASGASATLSKPFSADELLDTLRTAVETTADFDLDAPVRPGDDTLTLTLEELGEVSASEPEGERVEVIDLSDDDEYAELELLEGLEPISPDPAGIPYARSGRNWEVSDLPSGSSSESNLDLNLGEFLKEPAPVKREELAEEELAGIADIPSPGDRETEISLDLGGDDIVEPLREPQEPPPEPGASASEAATWGGDTGAWSEGEALDLTTGPVAPPEPESDRTREYGDFDPFTARREDSAEEDEPAFPGGLGRTALETPDGSDLDRLSARVSQAAETAVRDALTSALTAERLAPAVETVVERVVWEVVPPLAERLIREAIDKIRREPPPRNVGRESGD